MEAPITEALHRAAQGDRAAFDAVFAAMYPDLRRIARARLFDGGRFSGLGTTSLVHESFLRLVQSARLELSNRRHFFALASRCMRLTIIDELRQLNAERRGGGATHLSLGEGDDLALAGPAVDEQAEELHEALRELERLDPELAEVADLRWFGGFGESEIAELQGVTERTVRRRWDKARAFLLSMLREDGGGEAPAAPGVCK
jgi:RNA polymerase sigma factor (TIGR02999 family)